MSIRDKIKLYCTEKGISLAEFARSVNETPQNLNSMLSGKSRMNADLLIEIRKSHPSIDLNRLLDEKDRDYFYVVAEAQPQYENDFKRRLAEDAAKVIQLMERYK